jgi:HD-like signal output (HDOD) protein
MTSSAEHTDSERRAALETMLHRLRSCSGFPALSTTASDINRVVDSDLHTARQLTQVILRDVSLTTRLLQVVNSAIYSQYHGRIRTVSKAVLILGCDEVRNAAMTLMMLDFSKGRPQDRTLQDELIGAFFAGVVSKALCERAGAPSSEEAVICSMFQSLGRLLVVSFLYEESRQVRALMETGLSEELASERVLGISYRELSVGVARHWNFPERLIEGMQKLPPRSVGAPGDDLDRLKVTANLANDLYLTALRSPAADRSTALQELSRRYSAAVKLDAKELLAALERGLREIAERSVTFELPTTHSVLLNVIRKWTGVAAGAEAPAIEEAPHDDTVMLQVHALDAIEDDGGVAMDPAQTLAAGIRDVTETLTSDFALNDVLQMVLETMYRGMGFSRTLIFVRDVRQNTMRARFGFGADIERIIPQCTFPLAFAPDVFHVALEKGVDVVIDNTHAENISQRIPQWHRQLVSAKSFLLLPVMLKNCAVGLLYADSDREEGVKVDAEQLGLLRTLRSQVALAFKHSGQGNRA